MNLTVESDVYTVEKIENRRYRNGKLEYYLKWLNYAESENTWEPAASLGCFELIKNFEKKRKEEKGYKKPAVKSEYENVHVQSFYKDMAQKKIDNKLAPNSSEEPISVHGAALVDGKIMLLVKYKNNPQSKLEKADIINYLCPNLVIEYYETRIAWNDTMTK